ncbi:MAG: hypothetical protein EOS36_23155 [Mesorhizobium sp.]|uniref:ATP-dependent Clp protease proteolytic subunit n=1 Tax=Mesorhizobium sp. TaxID=1871066 RepID=UPI000FE75D08|nr:ATP-dependent Clp protease proteolytic subunit [Mesorhizobium sp.]RWD59907.1 MAG: hypothetical protein EOS36_23155 [Mesorhizobium sp.]
MKAGGSTRILQVSLSGIITDTTKIVAAIKENPDLARIVIKLDSPGGSHNEACHILNALLVHNAHVTVVVGKECKSAALLILMAGHHRICHPDAIFAIHAPTHKLNHSEERYTAAELRRLADLTETAAEDFVRALALKPEHKEFIEQSLIAFEPQEFGVEKAKELGLIHATVEEELKLRFQQVTRAPPRPVPIKIDAIVATWALRNRLVELSPVPSWTDATEEPEDGQTTILEVLDPTGTTVLTTHSGLTGTSFPVPVASFAGNSSGWIRFGSERDGYREWQAYQLQVAFTAVEAGAFVLTGNPVNLTQGVVGGVGTFVLTGNPVGLNVSMPVSVGSYTLTGNDVSFSNALSLSADPASFALTGIAATLTFVSQMTHSYEGATVDNTNASSYTFTGKNVGSAGAGRVLAVAVNVSVSNIGTPRSISGVTCNGVAMTAGPAANGGASGQSSAAWFYIVEPTGTTANFVVTTSGGVTNCTIAVYRLFPVSSTPVDSVSTAGAPSATLSDLEVKTTGLALILSTSSGNVGSYSWGGIDTPVNDEINLTNDRPSPTNTWSISTTENDTTRDFTINASGSTIRAVGISFQ